VIAVRKLQENAPMPADKTFSKEVQNVMALKHENIVQLVAFCSETTKKLVQFDGKYIQAEITESLLCYEYLPDGSLEEKLFGSILFPTYSHLPYFLAVSFQVWG
jgi:serine/threonine protein kinase